MDLTTVLIIAFIFIILYILLKKVSNPNRPHVEEQFDQAGVRVSYSNGTIAIDKSIYDVSQVSGIHLKALKSPHEKYYDNETKNVIIEIDDKRKPTHKINFVTRAQAERFILRLVTALKKAGSPKSI